ncbi:carboxymuconolactone decarboxylase family protein [Aureimonas fodinaquatilis]|uniref:Carboxymuconolactone decarboxylase family protein n=1 Tax=Aureimonas fodinaquatilis TaxID=2565783 RepID=A0A5B0DT46_9HYPH|nr:carboxymuconolactone decarboxylase family protein [Aureimonas fodinaquatilis]KAA0969578.1 carboxymuconolactone decarboxylase family protein [Aureimonas fodinaquatilis]
MTTSRLEDLDEANLSPAQKVIYDQILSGPRGIVEGPLRVWLKSPKLADKAQALGAFCRYDTNLPPRLSELAIITTGAVWRAGFEWAVHAPIAIKAGVSPQIAEAIRLGQEPQFEAEDEAAVYAFSRELHENRGVSDATYQRCVAALGEEVTVELVGILGYYTFISMTINAFHVPLPAGASDPFPAK